MRRVTPADIAATEVTIVDLTQYLSQRGWTAIESPRPQALLFRSPPDSEGQTITAVLPREMSCADAYVRLAEVVNLFAELDEVEADVILSSLGNLGADILRIRLAGASRSSVPFDTAYGLFESLKSFVGGAAIAESDPRPFIVAGTPVSSRYLHLCRFGHTFPGSFGFTIQSPIQPAIVQATLPSFPEAVPFERRVFQRIARGLKSLRGALHSGSPRELVDGYKTGFNANMCEALCELGDLTDEQETVYTIAWSPSWSAAEDVSGLEPVRVKGRGYDFLKSAARELRVPAQVAEVDVYGPVLQLRAGAQLLPGVTDEAAERTVTIEWLRSGRRSTKVRVSLSAEEYREACNAHRDGRVVSVLGRLDLTSKPPRLLGPKRFRIVTTE